MGPGPSRAPEQCPDRVEDPPIGFLDRYVKRPLGFRLLEPSGRGVPSSSGRDSATEDTGIPLCDQRRTTIIAPSGVATVKAMAEFCRRWRKPGEVKVGDTKMPDAGIEKFAGSALSENSDA